MPFASLEIFAIELVLLQETGADAVIPRSEAGTEPFHAVYRRETCLPYIQSALEGGKRRVDAWFSEVYIRYLELEEILPYDPDKRAFLNINTPEELREAERHARVGTAFDRMR
jgi:molybdopterin-guanine dinucleotide biosynthesis protein A